MHPSGWIQLLQLFPVEQIPNLALVTTSGMELSLQSIVRLEEEYLLARARVSGSSEAGRAFFIPYDQINFLGFQKPVKEAVLHALFGDDYGEAAEESQEGASLAAGAPGEQQPVAADEPPPEAAPAVAQEPPPEAKPVPARSNHGQALPTKAEVLANLRTRLKAGSNRRGTNTR